MRWLALWVMVVSAVATGVVARGATAAGEATTTISLIATSPSQKVTDLPPKGQPNKGDAIRGTSVLRNAVRQFGKPAGAVVGRDRYSFTFVSSSEVIVDVRVELPGGTLHGRSRLHVPQTNRLVIAIVGGTGKFAGARGTGEAQDLSPSRALNVYRLRFPETA